MTAPAGPLLGLRVLDLTQGAAGPYCTRLLASYGADVIKVEKPGTGDPMRYCPPFVGDKPGPDTSLAFLHLNVNKRGITLDLGTPAAEPLLTELIRRSDVVVESFQPGTLAEFGFPYEHLARLQPRIVLTSISNFGQTGPYRDLPASEIVLYGMGHAMFGTGQPDAEPMSMAPRVNLHFAGQTAAVATMSAVLAAEARGNGDWIDVSIMETFASSVDRRAISLTAYEYTKEKMVRLASVTGMAVPPPYNPCADGYFHITVGAAWWDPFVAAIGEDFVRDPRFVPPMTDLAAKEEFDSFWIPWCLARTKREIVEVFQAGGLPCAPVNSIADLATDPHLEERGFFQWLTHPVAGAARYAGLPFAMADTPGGYWKAAPTLGESNAEVLAELGCKAPDIEQLAAEGVI